jgi:hypothetical protein
MKKKIFWLAFFILPISGINAGGQVIKSIDNNSLVKASELYSAGDFKGAYDIWMSLYDSGLHSASLNYNIGNACFKLNDVPGAILFYERALLLKPGDEDINYNLGIARTLVVDKFAEIPEVFFVTWFNFISLSLSTNSWALISIVTFILTLIFISVYFYTSRYMLKITGFWLAVFLLLVSIMSLTFSVRNKNLVYHNTHAIIFSPAVNGKSSPDQSGKDLFVLHEGTKVSVEDELGEWYEIRLSDGNKGWVPSNSLTRL